MVTRPDGRPFEISKETEAMKRGKAAATAGLKGSQAYLTHADRLDILESKIDIILNTLQK